MFGAGSRAAPASRCIAVLKRKADAMTAMRDQVNTQHCTIMPWALAPLGLYDRRLVGCLLGGLAESSRRREGQE